MDCEREKINQSTTANDPVLDIREEVKKGSKGEQYCIDNLNLNKGLETRNLR